MTSRHVRYLWKRDQSYYIRLTFPKSLRARVRRVDVRVSLRTSDHVEASALAFRGALAFRRLCAKLRSMKSLSKIDVHTLVREFHAWLLTQSEQLVPVGGGEQDESREWNRAHTEDRVHGLRRLLETDELQAIDDGTSLGLAASSVRAELAELAKSKDINLGSLSDVDQRALAHGVARAMLDEYQSVLHQLDDPLTPYKTTDPFFADTATAPQALKGTASAPDGGISIGEAIDAFIKAKAGVTWKPKSETEFRRVLRWVSEHFGDSTPLSAITKVDVREFRNAVIRVRRHAKPKTAFADIQTDIKSKQIDRKTSRKHFHLLVSAYNWWVEEGHVDASPVGKLKVDVPKVANAKARTPFTQKELAAFFTSPIYVGCLGPTRRTTPGSKIIRDGYYWVPIVGALTGMRLGEIVQLGLKDVDVDADIPVIQVRADEETGGTIKSAAGWRAVPVHRRLIELGFLDFVRTRQKVPKAKRIFAEIPYGSDGSPSAEYSRWFGRRLDALKLKRPGLVFHSFRHTFIDALREADAPGYVLQDIVGHEKAAVTDGYGQGVTLSAKQKWIDKIELLDELPSA